MFQPRFSISLRLLQGITELTELRAWINQSTVDVPWIPLLQRDTANRLSHSSTSIEGNPLSLSLVEAVARGEETGAPSKAVSEVRNYLAALHSIWKDASWEKIIEKDLFALHRTLMKDLLPNEKLGCYKQVANRVVDPQGKPVYFPPDPELAAPLTRELLEWITTSKEKATLHPAIISAIAHHRLVSIHPFSDGNGRISRLLACLILYRSGFDTQHLFAIDEYYDADRKRYYDQLQLARDLDDDLSDWLEYCVEGLIATLQKTKQRILSLDVHHASTRLRLTAKQEVMLRMLREKPWIAAAELASQLHISRERMSELLRPLITSGIVVREGKTRATTYRLAHPKNK